MCAAATKKHPVIAVASGKGGTGKTTFAVNLASALDGQVKYIDADVEEPNGHIFLKPEITQEHTVRVMVPEVNPKLCNGCGECRKVCNFNALIVLKKNVMLFPELCHSCGACLLVCPQKALLEGSRAVGKISMGEAGDISFVEGRLNEGEAKSPPVIKALRRFVSRDRVTIIDVAPGSSCPVIEGVRLSDFVVLVTEPTPFGLHDLVLAVGMVKRLGLPHGVVLNRADLGDKEVERYCAKEGLPVLMQIPFDPQIASLCSQGKLLVPEFPELKSEFLACYDAIQTILAGQSSKGLEQ